MNKILSLAIKKAVSEYTPDVKETSESKRPDLFSLNNQTELFQMIKELLLRLIDLEIAI